MKYYQIKLDGVSCAGCIAPVYEKLNPKSIPGLVDYSLDPDTKILSLEITDAQKKEALESLLKDQLSSFNPVNLIEVDDDVGAPLHPTEIRSRIRRHALKGALGLGVGLFFLLTMALGVHLPFAWMAGSIGIGTLLAAYLGWKGSSTALKQLWHEQALTMDLLFLVSALAAVTITLAHLFVPGLPMMIDAALLIFGFRHIGHAIEFGLKNQIYQRVRFKDILKKSGDYQVNENGQTVSKPFSALLPGMIIDLQPGQILPLDGVAQGEGWVNASHVTGEANLKVKAGEVLRSGITLDAGQKPMRVLLNTHRFQSFIYQYDIALKNNKQSKAPIEQRADRIVQYFLPALVCTALLAGIIVSAFFPWIMSVKVALYILVSACPCIFGMVTSLALYVGMMKSTKAGVTFMDKKHFEQAAAVDIVIFDITGTVTLGQFEVQTSKGLEDYLEYIAVLEAESGHPIARCIREYALKHNKKQTMDLKVSQLNDQEHGGLSAMIGGLRACLGNATYMKGQGFIVDDSENEHRIYFALGSHLKGHFCLAADPLRDDAAACIQAVKDMGKEVYFCSGLKQAMAQGIGQKFAVDHAHVFGDCWPIEQAGKRSKPQIISTLQEGGKKSVLMIGDGGNDAAAFKASNLAFAVKSAVSSDIAKGEAGALLNDVSKLTAIPKALRIAKHTMQHIDRNLMFSIAYNVASLTFAALAVVYFAQGLNPAVGAGIMFIQTFLVLGNTLLFKTRSEPQLPHTVDHLEVSPHHDYPLKPQRNNQDKKVNVFCRYVFGGSYRHCEEGTPDEAIQKRSWIALLRS